MTIKASIGQVGSPNMDMEDHPEISELIRVISESEPLITAQTKSFVIIGGGASQFLFTKTETGYTMIKKQ